MQDSGAIHAIAVARAVHDRQRVDSQSPDEYDEDEEEDESEAGPEILSQTPGQVGNRAKGKVVDRDVSSSGKKKKTRTRWAIPNKANLDFSLDIDQLIELLRPGQLLTADEVYSAPEWHGFNRNHPRRNVRVCFKTCDVPYVHETSF
jgi:hypothetical protein